MNLGAALESILFLHGEPIATDRLAKLAGAPKREVAGALETLTKDYRERGIILIKNGDLWQLATHPAHKKVVEKLVTGELAAELTKPALEALAIIAYKGPLSRAAIEYIRGVNSAFTVRSLLIRGLIDREVNPKDRRSYLYRTAPDLLKHLGIASPDDLPRYREFRSHPIPKEATASEAPTTDGPAPSP